MSGWMTWTILPTGVDAFTGCQRYVRALGDIFHLCRRRNRGLFKEENAILFHDLCNLNSALRVQTAVALGNDVDFVANCLTDRLNTAFNHLLIFRK